MRAWEILDRPAASVWTLESAEDVDVALDPTNGVFMFEAFAVVEVDEDSVFVLASSLPVVVVALLLLLPVVISVMDAVVVEEALSESVVVITPSVTVPDVEDASDADAVMESDDDMESVAVAVSVSVAPVEDASVAEAELLMSTASV